MMNSRMQRKQIGGGAKLGEKRHVVGADPWYVHFARRLPDGSCGRGWLGTVRWIPFRLKRRSRGA